MAQPITHYMHHKRDQDRQSNTIWAEESACKVAPVSYTNEGGWVFDDEDELRVECVNATLAGTYDKALPVAALYDSYISSYPSVARPLVCGRLA